MLLFRDTFLKNVIIITDNMILKRKIILKELALLKTHKKLVCQFNNLEVHSLLHSILLQILQEYSGILAVFISSSLLRYPISLDSTCKISTTDSP